MKTIASITILLLLSACASSTSVIDERGFHCGPGQDIEVRAGLDNGQLYQEIGGELRYLVEVANNSHNDVTVKSVRVEPSEPRIPGIVGGYRVFDQLVPEGEDHIFEIPTNVAWDPDLARQPAGKRIQFAVSVLLSNGDAFHCRFQGVWD